MANELIGEFDLAAELSIPAVNRLFAAMHQAERLLHSVSARVDDLDGCSQDKLPALERRPMAIHHPVADFQEVL